MKVTNAKEILNVVRIGNYFFFYEFFFFDTFLHNTFCYFNVCPSL